MYNIMLELMIRGDLSNRLIHLTKGNTLEEAKP
jgi:hypothetical protein